MLNNLRKTLANFIAPIRNSMTLPQQFLRYGNRRPMTPDWTQVLMSDEDLYSGYSYAVIRNRATAVMTIAEENIKTESELEDEDFTHPYLDAIDLSPTFPNDKFWYDISTYLDLEGVYYLMVIRADDGKRTGAIKEFKLLNPYHIKRIINEETLEVEGYIETRAGLIREIPPSMIIEMRELNPFHPNKPFAMTDAAKETQFTIKTADDYTRHTLKHNINAPGILSTDVILETENFENFKKRVTDHTKGEPLFGNGHGAITFDSMNIDLSKAALKDVNEIQSQRLLSIGGVSKTMMGIEQSGTTRDTARVQKDLMLEFQTIPRIKLILSALNQDYKNKYPDEYAKNKATLTVMNPSKTDHDADLKAAEVNQKRYDLYSALVNRGVDYPTAARYAEGEMSLEDIPITPQEAPVIDPKADPKAKDEPVNSLAVNSVDLIKQQEGSLLNAIANIDQKVVASCILRIESAKQKNDYEEELDVITQRDKKGYINDLELVLAGFYGVVMSLQGGQTMRDRTGEYSMPGHFSFDRSIKNYIKVMSNKAADSHINTIVKDVLKSAQESALAGKSLREIVSEIRLKYSQTISKSRAEVIAKTETNRAFTRAQFDSDRQFIKQNKLTGRAYKKWRTRSSNPCAFCQSLADEAPIPFDQAFRDLGGTIDADGKVLDVSYETLEAGNAHPNCFCTYDLIIKSE